MRFSSQSVGPRAEAIRVVVTARPASLQAACALAAATEKARTNDTATAAWRGMLSSPGPRRVWLEDLRDGLATAFRREHSVPGRSMPTPSGRKTEVMRRRPGAP